MAKNEFKKAIKTYAELEKTRKQNLKEYVQMFELVSGAKDMEPLKRGLGLIKGRKRKRKEAVQTNAERQKQFRERRKAEGCIRKETWEKLNPDLGYEYVKVNVHQSSFDSCKNILWDFPGFLEQLREKVGQGNFPMDIYQNIIEFLAVLGFDESDHQKRIESANEMLGRVHGKSIQIQANQ